MKHARILALLLALLFSLGLVGCEEEGKEVEEEAEVIPSKPGTFSVEPGEWVTYAIEEAGEVTLALIGEEEHGGVPGYWLELLVPEEGQKVVVKVLVEKEAYEEFGREVMEWLQKPEIPEEGLLAGAMASTGMETAEEDLKAGLEEFNRIVMRLLVEAEGQAFEIDLPSFTKLIGDQAAAGMEMAAEMAEAYGGEEEAEEVALPTFDLVKGVTVEAGGKTYACDKIVVTYEGESAEIFFSSAVPFFGLVKVVAEGGEPIVVKDFGRAGYESQFTSAKPMKINAESLMMMFMGAAMMQQGGGMPGGMPGGMEGMDPEMLKALEELSKMGG